VIIIWAGHAVLINILSAFCRRWLTHTVLSHPLCSMAVPNFWYFAFLWGLYRHFSLKDGTPYKQMLQVQTRGHDGSQPPRQWPHQNTPTLQDGHRGLFLLLKWNLLGAMGTDMRYFWHCTFTQKCQNALQVLSLQHHSTELNSFHWINWP
jgi:hypothetical protein